MERRGDTGAGKRPVGIKKMRRWVLAIAILAAAVCFFLGAQAQEVRQGHQTERISGGGPLFFLCYSLLGFDLDGYILVS